MLTTTYCAFRVVRQKNPRAAVWCNLDPCGLLCAVITYGLVAYSQYAVTVCVVGQWLGFGSFFGMLHVAVFNTLACLAHASHARAMLTDPGAVSSRALVRLRAAAAAKRRGAAAVDVLQLHHSRGEQI